MNIDALKHLISILEQIKKEKRPFDLGNWVTYNQNNPVCGTACCAMGYAALDPVFQAAGLTFHVKDSDGVEINIETVQDFNKLSEMEYVDDDEFYFKFKNIHDDGYDIAVKLFGFENHITTEILFYPGYYEYNKQRPKNVIERIMYLIDNGETALLSKFKYVG